MLILYSSFGIFETFNNSVAKQDLPLFGVFSVMLNFNFLNFDYFINFEFSMSSPNLFVSGDCIKELSIEWYNGEIRDGALKVFWDRRDWG